MNDAWIDIVFLVAIDGPVFGHHPFNPTFWCLTNDVITSDWLTDPADCVGTTGYFGPTIGGWAKSTLTQQNDPWNPISTTVTPCHGYDGYAWLFLWPAFWYDHDDTLIYLYPFVPLSGHIFHD